MVSQTPTDMQRPTDMQAAYRYAVDQMKDTNPYYNVIEGWNRPKPNDKYTFFERALVLLMSMCTDFAAAVLVAQMTHDMRATPNEDDCFELVTDVWQCRSTETMSAERKWVVELILTIIFATIFSTVLGGSALQKGFRIECCCQWILYVWLVIILAVASLLLIFSLDFSEECKFGCYKCFMEACDQCLPPIGESIDDTCEAGYKLGAAESAILWGTTQIYHNSLFVLPQVTLFTFLKIKVRRIPCIGPYIGLKKERYKPPKHKRLNKWCAKKCCASKSYHVHSCCV